MIRNMGLHKLRAWASSAALDASHAPVKTIAAIAAATASVYLLPGYILMFFSGPFFLLTYADAATRRQREDKTVTLKWRAAIAVSGVIALVWLVMTAAIATITGAHSAQWMEWGISQRNGLRVAALSMPMLLTPMVAIFILPDVLSGATAVGSARAGVAYLTTGRWQSIGLPLVSVDSIQERMAILVFFAWASAAEAGLYILSYTKIAMLADAIMIVGTVILPSIIYQMRKGISRQ